MRGGILLTALAATCLLSACHKAPDISLPEDVSAGMSEQLVLKRMRQICPACTTKDQGGQAVIVGFSSGRFGEKAEFLVLHHSSDVILAVTVGFLYDDRGAAERTYDDFVAAQSADVWKDAQNEKGKCIYQMDENRMNHICLNLRSDKEFSVTFANQFSGFRR